MSIFALIPIWAVLLGILDFAEAEASVGPQGTVSLYVFWLKMNIVSSKFIFVIIIGRRVNISAFMPVTGIFCFFGTLFYLSVFLYLCDIHWQNGHSSHF